VAVHRSTPESLSSHDDVRAGIVESMVESGSMARGAVSSNSCCDHQTIGFDHPPDVAGPFRRLGSSVVRKRSLRRRALRRGLGKS
jgi:hypothetical protein